MAARLQGWLSRQSLTVKLLLAVPFLLVAILWSTLPGNDTRTSDPGNRPVLSAQGSPTAQAGQGTILAHEEPRPADTSLSWATVLRTIVSVVIVVVLILISGQGLKYVMTSAAQPTRGAATSLRVLETLHLPSPTGRGRAAIHLVEVGEHQLLVGATDTQLSLLAELPDDAAAKLRSAASAVPHGTTSATNGTANGTTNGTFAATLAALDGDPAFESTLTDRSATTNSATLIDRHNRHNGAAFDEANLAQLLQRLRESKQRLETER